MKNPNNAELHTHSYYSDGSLSPKELINLAKKKKIKYLALTDHNSISGVSEAVREGKRSSVKVIPAVEINTNHSEILGYFIDIKNKKLRAVLKQIRKQEYIRIKDYCLKLNKAGVPITFKEVNKLCKKKNFNGFYILWPLHMKGFGSTMNLAGMLSIIRKKMKIKLKPEGRIGVISSIRLIKKTGGVPVLAHPWVDKNCLKQENIKRWVKAGLKGIEISNGDCSPFKKKGTDKIIRLLAKKYKLIITSGSDYHGEKWVRQMPGNHGLGKNNCDEAVVRRLEALKEIK